MTPPRLDWTGEPERWVELFMDALGHSTRRRMCPAYVAGLIGPGDHKSVQPMVDRVDEVNTTSFTISSAAASETQRRWKRLCWLRPTN